MVAGAANTVFKFSNEIEDQTLKSSSPSSRKIPETQELDEHKTSTKMSK